MNTQPESKAVLYASVATIAILVAGLVLRSCSDVAAQQKKPVLTIIGDSIAFGLNENSIGADAVARLSERYEVRSMGNCGATAHSTWVIILSGAIKTDTDEVWLLVGYNDRVSYRMPENDIQASIEAIRGAFPDARFTHTDTFAHSKKAPRIHLKDGVHPNAAGYDALVSWYLAHTEPALKETAPVSGLVSGMGTTEEPNP